MNIKQKFFLIGSLLPFTVSANFPNARITPDSNIKTRVETLTLLQNNETINTKAMMEPQNIFSISEGMHRVAHYKTNSDVVNASEKMWPVKIQIKGLGEEVPYAEPIYFNAESCDRTWDYEMEGDIMTVMVPEGLNDIVILYGQRAIVGEYDGYPVSINRGDCYYFIEDVTVGPDTPLLEADIEECHSIPMEIQLGDGQTPVFSTLKWNGDEFVQTKEGNISIGGMDIVFYNSTYDYMIPFSGFRGTPAEFEGYDNLGIEFWQPKMNKASDKWVFAYSATLLDNENNTSNFAWLMTPNTEKVIITKDDYTQIPWGFNEVENDPVKGMSCTSVYSINNSHWNESQMGHVVDVLLDQKVNIYLTNKDLRVKNNTDEWSMSFAYTAANKVIIYEDWDDFALYGIRTPDFILNNKCGMYLPSTGIFAVKYYNSEDGWVVYDEGKWGNPEFNYNIDNMGIKFNESAPYVVTYFGYESEHDSDIISLYYPESKIYGLAGENRNSLDWSNQKYTIYFNGELVNEPESSIFSFLYDWNPSEKGEGILKMEVLAETDLYLDGIQAKNTRTVILHQGAKDWAAPTVTCLQPRDDNNLVTNRFECNREGHIVLSASDIHPNIYWQYWEEWKEWMPYSWFEVIYGTEVKVEVSPCGEDQWQEIEAVATGQKNPTLGDFYDVSLSQVTSSSDNGWYDLRITVTDKTGNSQQQTITPAFYVENQTTGIITDQTNNLADVKAIYNISGNKLSSMQPGLNIVVYSDGTCKKVLVK